MDRELFKLTSLISRSLLPLVFLQGSLAHADYADDILAKVHTTYTEEADEGYIINFTDVSIIEYIRFISKILGVNFTYNEAELKFNVTIVSEEPQSGKNVLSALIQVLRIRGLHLIEQNNNLMITTNPEVKEISVVVADEIPDSKERRGAIITRIFRIKNTNASAIAEILRPMISASALLEVMASTNQLIISDVATNVDQVAEILLSLDSPVSPLEVDTYECKNINPEKLLVLANQILEPFKQSKPLTLVAQPETNSIYIVGTDALIERTLTVLEDLDIPSKEVVGDLSKAERVFIYQVKNKSPDYLLDAIAQISSQMKKTKAFSPELLDSFESVKWMPGTNSLVFIGTGGTFSVIQALLDNLDIASTSKGASFYLYSIGNIDEKPVESWLKQIATDLANTANPDTGLIDAIRHMKWFKETHSFLFTGTEETLSRLKDLLTSPAFTNQFPPSLQAPQFWIFHPPTGSSDAVQQHLKDIAANLKAAGLSNPSLLNAIKTMQYEPSTNSLIFTGDVQTLEDVKSILTTFENGLIARDQQTSFLVYKPKARTPDIIESSLKEIAQDLKASGLADPNLLYTISSIHFVKSNQSFLFTGSADSLKKMQELLATVDVSDAACSLVQQFGTKSFLLYKANNIQPAKIASSLKAMAQDLEKSDHFDRCLIDAIRSVKIISDTNSLLFTGEEKSLKEVEELVAKFDTSTKLSERTGAPSGFVLYMPKYQTGQELITMLDEFRDHLTQIGVVDQDLFDTINHLKWVEKSRSILLSGSAVGIARVEELLTRFDTPSIGEGGVTIQPLEETSFLVYKLQYNNGSAIQEALTNIGKELASKDHGTNKQILNAIHSLQWIKTTNSLIGTGQQHALEKLKELIRNLDIPLKQVFMEVLVVETTLTNTQAFGLQWGGKIQYLNKFAGAYGNFPPTTSDGSIVSPSIQQGLGSLAAKGKPALRTPQASDVPFAPSGFDLGIIGDILFHRGRSFLSLGSLVNALQTDTDTVILLNPKIITQDNNNSTLFVGQNIPFVGSQINSTQAATTIMATTNLEYRDIGLNLSITPTLSTSDVVTLDISTDISREIGTQSFGSNGVQGITTSHTSMSTRVTVPNKHFLILSGMLRDDKDHTRAQVPCLGGLPIIGAAFSQNNRSNSKANVLIFLKPHIINSFDEYRALTEDQEVLLKEESGPSIMGEEVEHGLEWVKTPEDN